MRLSWVRNYKNDGYLVTELKHEISVYISDETLYYFQNHPERLLFRIEEKFYSIHNVMFDN